VIEQEAVNAQDVLDLLERLDALRRPERLIQFRLACLADVRGRPGFEDKPDRGGFLVEALQAARSVSVSSLNLGDAPSGEEIKAALQCARIKAIAQVVENTTKH
ncbi:MAG TPA: hypothetical protein VI522_07315, partial [Gammaproteobacteria bacterium]|nr:hypothetical protein [Gammaproteobacteria bacterium]